ncbi:MAG: transketolase [Treponema sp.]|jgi:transketolase|nr:transketolase [Treponema sp.]
MTEKETRELNKFAVQIRMGITTQLVKRGFGHIGGCFSCAELFAVLYGTAMNIDPKNPARENRDRLIISKGHAGPAAYAALALKGYFPTDWLLTLNEGGTRLPSHCDRLKTPGIDFSTGSLGQGLSAGAGIACAYTMDKRTDTVFVLLGDGEIQEGQIWEAAMSAAKYRLGNLIAFVDYNKIQLDGTVEAIMPLGDLDRKWLDFGWHVQRVNGHDVASIKAAIDIAKSMRGQPSVILLDTIKGCGAEEVVSKKHLNHHMHIDAALGNRIMDVLETELKKFA